MRAFAAALLIAASLAASPAAGQDFPYEQFSPDSLGAFAERIEMFSRPSADERVVLLGRVTKVRVQATYVGEHSPLDEITSGIILRYAERVTEDPEGYAGLYREFYAFDDGGKRYWLPVQHPVAANFEEALEPGERIELYALAVGGLAAPNQKLQPLLLVQQFGTKDGPAPLPAPAPAD
jgi:hypothetical protein